MGERIAGTQDKPSLIIEDPLRDPWGGDTGVPISHIPDFLPPNIPYPRFFNPNIPYPRFFNPQYPISQISQSIDHIPDCVRLECVCIHSFDIQLLRMDPILLDIFIIAVNILVHGHL